MSDRLLKESDVLKAIDKRIEELSKDPVFIRKNGIIDIIGVKKYILAIPSAEPKRGRWKIEEAETIYGKAYLLTCSECGKAVSVTEAALPYEHFCRNCGADMRGENHEID